MNFSMHRSFPGVSVFFFFFEHVSKPAPFFFFFFVIGFDAHAHTHTQKKKGVQDFALRSQCKEKRERLFLSST